MNSKSLCCIFNYNHNDNADFLYKEFNKYMTCVVFDSNSDNPYDYFVNVSNLYYTNLFNHAIQEFKSKEYKNLLIITSDILMDEKSIRYVGEMSNEDLDNIGILQLQTDESSRDWYNHFDEKKCKRHKQYETQEIEGFFQLINGDIAQFHSKIPLTMNKYGVCIDKYSCILCKLCHKKLIIDTTYLIHHPQDKGYDFEKSHSYDMLFKFWCFKEINKKFDISYEEFKKIY